MKEITSKGDLRVPFLLLEAFHNILLSHGTRKVLLTFGHNLTISSSYKITGRSGKTDYETLWRFLSE
jgi:hypothetical protein